MKKEKSLWIYLISLILLSVISTGCRKDGESEVTYHTPSVSTVSVSEITSTTAIVVGNLTSEGGASVTARGVCWNTSSSPTISNNVISVGTGTGYFAGSLTGLTSKTKYYVRAYGTNSYGTAYGNELVFTTL